jgi:DNA-binding transcriptional LysR family regulator
MCTNEQQAMANRKPSQSWDNLRYFLAVARTGTLSAAAEQLGTEHTTVGRHVHALEEELNSRLFHRSNSDYGLTEVGEGLLPGLRRLRGPTPPQRLLRAAKDRRSVGRFASAHPMGSAASSWRQVHPGRGSAPRLHILVETKEVCWIVLGLEFDQALVIAPKRRPDQLSAFVPEKIHQVAVA